MHPFLVCLSIVLLSECLDSLAGDNISDLSDDCFKGRKISIYLTSGMGVSDMYVAMIAKESVNCTINFLVNKGNYIIVVIEFLDWFLGKPQCGSANNEVNVILREGEVTNVCSKVEENIFRKIGTHEVSVSVIGVKYLQSVKITATSIKASSSGKCKESEIICIYEDKIYCMAEESKCDGNANCGVRYKYDEYQLYCKPYNAVKPDMILVGLVIVFMTFFLMVALLRKLMPSREGPFIVKEDETLSEKDRATGEKDFQIKIRFLYDETGSQPENFDLIREMAEEQAAIRRGMSLRKVKRS